MEREGGRVGRGGRIGSERSEDGSCPKLGLNRCDVNLCYCVSFSDAPCNKKLRDMSENEVEGDWWGHIKRTVV